MRAPAVIASVTDARPEEIPGVPAHLDRYRPLHVCSLVFFSNFRILGQIFFKKNSAKKKLYLKYVHMLKYVQILKIIVHISKNVYI
jgi:hypothetical protein